MECEACASKSHIYLLGKYSEKGCIGCMRRLLRQTPKGKARQAMLSCCELTAPETYAQMMEQIEAEKKNEIR